MGDWGLGIGDLGVGDVGSGPTPNPPFPNPQSPIPNKTFFFDLNTKYIKQKIIKLNNKI